MPDHSDEILIEAKGARQTSERLSPLLDLLKEQDGGSGPLDKLKGLLRAILQILSHHQAALHRIERACAIGPPHSH